MTKSFTHMWLNVFKSAMFLLLIPICMMGCWPAPYYHSWKGHIVTPSGKPLKDATIIIRNYHSCANFGGSVPMLLDVKSIKTDADGYFSIFTIGMNLDFFALIALCFGTQVEQYVCSNGKWQGAEHLPSSNGILQFNPTTARSDDLYWYDELPRYVKKECGQ